MKKGLHVWDAVLSFAVGVSHVNRGETGRSS